uniref:Uncharacterized protein n=1 Tax=Plectus sambesii TaxID=2011161 RepID=A0A914WI73_9BILA
MTDRLGQTIDLNTPTSETRPRMPSTLSTLSALIQEPDSVDASQQPFLSSGATAADQTTKIKAEVTNVPSPSLDRMPHLKQLIMGSEEDVGMGTALVPEPMEVPEPQDTGDALDKLLADGKPLPETNLGNAVDAFRQRWVELVACTSTKVGYKPPDQEHLKENAELIVAQLADAGRKLDAELARTAIRWTLRRPEMALKEELDALRKTIDRQQTLLARTEGHMNRRLQEFGHEFHNRSHDIHGGPATKL